MRSGTLGEGTELANGRVCGSGWSILAAPVGIRKLIPWLAWAATSLVVFSSTRRRVGAFSFQSLNLVFPLCAKHFLSIVLYRLFGYSIYIGQLRSTPQQETQETECRPGCSNHIAAKCVRGNLRVEPPLIGL